MFRENGGMKRSKNLEDFCGGGKHGREEGKNACSGSDWFKIFHPNPLNRATKLAYSQSYRDNVKFFC